MAVTQYFAGDDFQIKQSYGDAQSARKLIDPTVDFSTWTHKIRLYNTCQSVEKTAASITDLTAVFNFVSADTASLPAGAYNYAIWCEKTGSRITYCTGSINLQSNMAEVSGGIDNRTPARKLFDALATALSADDAQDRLMYSQQAIGDMSLSMYDVLAQYQKLKSIVAQEESEQKALQTGVASNFRTYNFNFRW